jgi:hypothetical protein
MTLNTVVFKPSILLGRSITRVGGVLYTRQDGHVAVEDGREEKTWTTTRVTEDLEEYKESERLASECRRAIDTVAVATRVGLIVPLEKEAELDEAIILVRKKIAEKNGVWKHSKLSCSFIKARIATDDQQAAMAIGQELSGFMKELTGALDSLDVKKIRSVVASVKGMDSLLPAEASKTLHEAMAAARAAANTISKEVEKKGRRIEEVREELNLAPIDVARTLFMESDEIIVQDAPADQEAADRMAAVEGG